MAAANRITTPRNKAGLMPEQEAYARSRAMGMSPQEAKVTCGITYSISTIRKWERTQEVSDRIIELSHLLSQNAIVNSGLDRSWVIQRLMTVVDRCMQNEPVRDKEGNPIGVYEFNSTGANQALRMLGDTLGLFKPVEKKPEDDYAHLSDDDLTRIARQLAQEVGIIEADPRIEAPPDAQ